MAAPNRRRFTITDAMILVAGAAVGLSGMRALYAGWLWPPPAYPGHFGDWALVGPPTCVVAALAVTILLLNVRRPRPRWRRLVIRPGVIACAATVAGILLGWGHSLLFKTLVAGGRSQSFTWVGGGFEWSAAARDVPEFVMGAWLALWLSGRWSPDPTWIDRTGRVVGVFWIAGFAWRLTGPIVTQFVLWL